MTYIHLIHEAKMTIDWAHFLPFQALLGGALIGLSASLLLIINGQIAGISGITSRVLERLFPHKTEDPQTLTQLGLLDWRILFLLGLVSSPLLFAIINQLPLGYLHKASLPLSPSTESASVLNISLLISGGFLVGIGARLANGCTSGHGVCGLARLSKRSFVAVGCFITSAMLTLYVTRHLLTWI